MSGEAHAATPAIELVVAIAENGVIGQGGTLPWRLKSDMQHFRAVTMGKPVVMGRKTFASLPRPLPGRTNIVVTRDREFAAAGVLVAPDLPSALQAARGDALRRGAAAIAVIGGADVYAQTLAGANRLIITHVAMTPAGDTRFPAVDSAVWQEISRRGPLRGPDDDANYVIVVYERKSHPA